MLEVVNGDELRRQYTAHLERRQKFWPATARLQGRKAASAAPQAEQPPADCTAPLTGPAPRDWMVLYHPGKAPQIEVIISAAAAYFRVPAREIVSEARNGHLMAPRQIAMYLAREMTLKSYPVIGKSFGGRDHTTILHAFRKIGRLIETCPEVAAQVAAVREVVGWRP
ncbi:helix-turn-helix domain-containing protein [Xanthobacter sp. DSM 24535]|uniref:helix-turn-helix domain-containing protein n=1 Tax=Roseixanthobacter psychrophilus TaxID=3119917 RepID=UPI00372B969D